MQPGTLSHVEREITEAENALFALHDQLIDFVELTDVAIRFQPPDTDRHLANLRKARRLAREEIAARLALLNELDAVRLQLALPKNFD